MRIAFVSLYDSLDVNKWSGIAFHIYKALVEAGVDVIPIFPLKTRTSLAQKFRRKAYRHLTGKKYSASFEPTILNDYARQIEDRLRETGPVDAIISPGSLPVATTYLKSDAPVFVWGDGTFQDLLGWYDEFTNFCDRTVFYGHESQRIQLDNTTCTIYCAPPFVRTSIERYGTDENRLAVIPFGANTAHDFSREEIARFIHSRPRDRCRLLFVGLDWERKQGDWAVATALELERQGLDIELAIVGSRPAALETLPKLARYQGFIDKSTESGRQLLTQLMIDSHFLILPTKADTFGIVFCEASSCGTPSLSTEIGGVSAAISNGKNGKLFPLEKTAFIEQCSSYIMTMMQNEQDYEKLCLSSFNEYVTRLNWQSAISALLDLIRERINCR